MKVILKILLFSLLSFQSISYAITLNLATNKKCEYNPRPNYHLTQYNLDPYLLTDGIIDKSLWFKRCRDKTVGWNYTDLIEIVIDLKASHNVASAKIYTVGGGKANVEYPEYIVVMTSMDGTNYQFSGMQSTDGWEFGVDRAIPRTIELAIEQKARYVKFLIRPTGAFFFSDEIEILKSDESYGNNDNKKELTNDKAIDFAERIRQLQRNFNGLSRAYDKSISQDTKRQTKNKIESLAHCYNSTVLQQVELLLSKYRANTLKSVLASDWVCRQVDPMDILRYEDVPVVSANSLELSFYQSINETGVKAFNLTNCSDDIITFNINISPLHNNDRTISSDGIFKLRRALYIRVINAGLVADPLVLQGAKSFSINPGETIQLWLEVNSGKLSSGKYIGAFSINAIGKGLQKKEQVIPISLDIADRTFFSILPFSSCNWDYVSIKNRFTSRSQSVEKEAILDLEEHYANVVVINQSQIFKASKGMLFPEKISNLLKLRNNETKPFFLFFMGGKPHLERRFGKFRTQEWDTKFEKFLAGLRKVLFDNGLDYTRFAIYPFDETVDDDFIYVAKAIRKFDPRLRIYANKWISPTELNKVKGLIDIWCPHLPDVLSNSLSFNRIRFSGNFEKVWTYYSNMPVDRYFAPEKTKISKQWRGDNHTFWRTMPIVAVALGIEGVGFWTYQDTNRSSWNKLQLGEYGVIYDGSKNSDSNCIPEAIIPSKRWEQWREGIEDAIALRGHPDLLAEFLSKPNNEITSEYLQDLRKRADKRDVAQK